MMQSLPVQPDCDDVPPAVLMIGVVVADALTIGGQPVVQPHYTLAMASR